MPPKRQLDADRAIVLFRFEKRFVQHHPQYGNLCALIPDDCDNQDLKGQLILRDKLIVELQKDCKVATQKVSLVLAHEH